MAFAAGSGIRLREIFLLSDDEAKILIERNTDEDNPVVYMERQNTYSAKHGIQGGFFSRNDCFSC